MKLLDILLENYEEKEIFPNVKVTKMVDDIGLINTIKFLGGYNNFKELYGGELSKEDKIKFIQEVIYKKVPDITGRNNISIFDLKVPPIRHDSYGITERMITTFYRGGVKLNVYKYGKFSTSQMTTYENISEDVLNKIFKLMIDLLERKQEEITEGLHDTSRENDGQSKIDKMINQIGLGGTVKFFGGYNKFKELYKGKITKEDKIDFINQSVKDKATEEQIDYITVGDYIDDWVYYHLDGNTSTIIDQLHVGFLRIEVFRMDDGISCVYQGSGDIMYEDLNDEQLNKVFNVVLDIV